MAAQPLAAPVAQSGLDNLPEETGAEAADVQDTGIEAKGPEATALPDPTPPQPQPDSPPVTAQVAQARPEAQSADTAEPTEASASPEALPLAAPALPIAAPFVHATPASPAPTGDSAPATPALSADTAPPAPAETSSAASPSTAEASPLAAPQAALPGSAPAPLTTAPLPQTLDLAAPQWPEQMVQDIRQGASANLDSLTLTLTPERLGPLQIRLETLDGVTHVHIVTETPEAARAMAEAQPRLAEAMARAGLEMGSQSTTTTGGSGGSGGFGTAGGDANPRGGQPGTEPGQPAPLSPAEETPTHPRALRSAARSSIDLIA